MKIIPTTMAGKGRISDHICKPIFVNIKRNWPKICRKPICIEKLQHQSKAGNLAKQGLMSATWPYNNTVVSLISSL